MLALAAERPSLFPARLIAVGGIIASGKSTVAEALAVAFACPVIDTDRTRKHLLGVPRTEPLRDRPFQDSYDPSMTERVYSEVARRTSTVLSTGRSAVVDASFRTRADRQAIREIAHHHDVPFLFVECRASHDVCRERLGMRAQSPSISDGRLEIFDDFVAHWETIDELRPNEHVVIDTEQPVDEVIEQLQQFY